MRRRHLKIRPTLISPMSWVLVGTLNLSLGTVITAHAELHGPQPRTLSSKALPNGSANRSADAGSEKPDAQELEAEKRGWPRGLFGLAFGLSYWPDLKNVKVSFDGEPFEPADISQRGFNAELSFHYNLVHWDKAALYVGGEFGFMEHGGQRRGFDFSARTLHVTPSAKLMVGNPESFRFFIGGGAGYYRGTVSTDEVEGPGGFGEKIEDLFSKNTFGGYGSLGLEIPISVRKGVNLRLENKVHMVNFGRGSDHASSGQLTGPINVLQIGLVFVGW